MRAEALADFTQALMLQLNLAEAYFHRARVHEQNAAWRAALADYKSYIRYTPPASSDPDLATAKRRVTEITQALPGLEAGGKNQ